MSTEQLSFVEASKWNPRYVHFARVHGRTPEEQAAADDARPTGRNLKFIAWVNERWSRYRDERKLDRFASMAPDDHLAFDVIGEALPLCDGACSACRPLVGATS